MKEMRSKVYLQLVHQKRKIEISMNYLKLIPLKFLVVDNLEQFMEVKIYIYFRTIAYILKNVRYMRINDNLICSRLFGIHVGCANA